MKQSEFQKCGSCGNGMAHNGQITFWRVSAERFMLNLKAVQRKHGLEMYFGGGQAGATLANVMGTDEDLAVIPVPVAEEEMTKIRIPIWPTAISEWWPKDKPFEIIICNTWENLCKGATNARTD